MTGVVIASLSGTLVLFVLVLAVSTAEQSRRREAHRAVELARLSERCATLELRLAETADRETYWRQRAELYIDSDTSKRIAGGPVMQDRTMRLAGIDPFSNNPFAGIGVQSIGDDPEAAAPHRR